MKDEKWMHGNKKEMVTWTYPTTSSSLVLQRQVDHHSRGCHGIQERRGLVPCLGTDGLEWMWQWKQATHFLLVFCLLYLSKHSSLMPLSIWNKGLRVQPKYWCGPSSGSFPSGKGGGVTGKWERVPFQLKWGGQTDGIRGQLSSNISQADRILWSQRIEIPYKCKHEPIKEIFDQWSKMGEVLEDERW